ncbi:hypothetical protein F4782DRAFT_511907 [Xylaria castorea]|nr:hypothetical protein F4782DRAFT_511907 [Xylaria castorea]
MPHTTSSSMFTHSGSTPSYPQELDIADGSGSGTSSSGSSTGSSSNSSTGRPLMSYSTPFGSNWQKDFGGSSVGRHYQTKANSSTRGNAGSNP